MEQKTFGAIKDSWHLTRKLSSCNFRSLWSVLGKHCPVLLPFPASLPGDLCRWTAIGTWVATAACGMRRTSVEMTEESCFLEWLLPSWVAQDALWETLWIPAVAGFASVCTACPSRWGFAGMAPSSSWERQENQTSVSGHHSRLSVAIVEKFQNEASSVLSQSACCYQFVQCLFWSCFCLYFGFVSHSCRTGDYLQTPG